MSDQDKNINKLPAILQTTATKNFFESTVDQLFSKANVENIQGFIGSPRGRDVGAQGAYLQEVTATKRFYGLSPTVNTLNPESGDSENLIFYDELIDILDTYGVDVRNHNKIFSENYAGFLPPIDIDKFVNYPEYYWYPEGPSAIEVSGTLESPIDVDDVLGSANFQPPGGLPFRNGMIVKFVGEFVIPQTRVGIEYIVQGVGKSIFFVPKVDNFSTRFSTPAQDQYDVGLEDTASSVQEVHSSSLLLDTVDVISAGQGYTDPEILVYDPVRVSVNDSNGDAIEDLRKYWDDTAPGYVGEDLREIDPDTGLALTNVINLAHVVESLSVDRSLAEYQELATLYADFRTGNLANLELTLDSNTGISNATITNSNHLYSDQVKYLVYDEVIEHTANIDALLAQVGEFDLEGNVAQFETNIIICDQSAGVSTPVAGQLVETVDSNKTALFTGVVQSATSDGTTITITLENTVTIPVDVEDGSVYEYNLKFTGFGFQANLVLSDFVNIVTVGAQSIVAPDGTVRTEPVLEVEPKLDINGDPVQQKPGRNPNNFADYYVINALPGFDQDSTFPWSGTDTQEIPDYLLQQRGAPNRNVWSRVNFWYHKENFRDAGDNLPSPSLQARRPIIEFDRDLELFNHGERSLGFVTVASDLPFADIDGRTSGLLLDGVPVENSTFIFPGGAEDTAGYIYTAQTVVEPTTVTIVDPSQPAGNADAVIAVTDIVLSGEGAQGYIESIGVSAGGAGYTANATVEITSPFGQGAQAQPVLDANGSVVAITLFDRTPTSITINNNTATVTFDQPHGLQNGDTVNVIDAEPPQYNGTYEIIAINDTQFTYEPDVRPVTEALTLPLIKTGGRQYYQTGTIRVSRLPDPELSATGAVDGETDFVPLQASPGDTVQILGGTTLIGAEFYYNGTDWIQAQTKLNINQPPLFNLYDTQGNYLADPGVYPESNFAGNQIFGYAQQAPDNDSTAQLALETDSVLGFRLVFKQFKATSEILFENFLDTQQYQYTPLGSQTPQDTQGYHYYLLNRDLPEYHSVWRTVTDPVEQRIRTFYNISQLDLDNGRRRFFVGGQPNVMQGTPSGYDIRLRINNKLITDYSYGTTTPGYIDLGDTVILEAGDFVEADISSVDGLFSTQSISKYDTPLGWGRNPFNQDIQYISEPEYLEHFADYLEQPGLQGEPLGLNNSSSLDLDPRYAQQIVSTSQDILLGAYLLDDQPHNLVDAIRFVGKEFTKYKNRVRSELERYRQTNDIENQTPDSVLEQILRNVISFRVANQVFENTYVIPFGDNFEQEQITVALDQDTFVFQNTIDLDRIENSLLLYRNDELLRIDNCYSITDFAPVTVQIHGCVNLQPGDIITARFYNQDRDSAQCPPTPSVLGLYPLYVPAIITDDTFQGNVDVILGHDGSRTPLLGDSRDLVLLEFEKRIYNAAKQEFRERNSLPEYNVFDVRDGAFRSAGYSHQEFYDLMRTSFAHWTQSNDVDPVTNEFFDQNNPWTWNYGNASLPGHWRGVYEYYYDTVQPHQAPWEMLGFTEKPLWWDSEYTRTEFNVLGEPVEVLSYGSDNTALWQDLELGIIRQGPRQNVTGDRYLTNNPYARPGLSEIIPVNSQGELIPPYELFSTATTVKQVVWDNTETGTVDADFEPRSQIWIRQDGTNVGLDTSNVYVSTPEYSYTIPRKDLHLITQDSSAMPDNRAVGALITGEPLYGIQDTDSWQSGGEWNYDLARRDSDVTRIITPESLGYTSWQDADLVDEATGHSRIVGWAFDGLPIYGPYGYQDPQDPSTEIVPIQSAWQLRTGNRSTGPGGAHTGVFVQDYQFAGASPGKADAFNHRYGVTPDSPTEPIHYYVVTVDENLEPTFPYQVGGGVAGTGPWENSYFHQAPAIAGIERIIVLDQGGLYDANTTVTITGDGTGATANAVVEDGRIVAVTVTNAGKNYTTATATVSGTGVRARLSVVISTADNSTAQGYQNPEATPVFTSVSETQLSADQAGIAQPWKFGDGAPVENAWRYSEDYPFAIAQALLLAKPGRFARVFAKPDKLFRPVVDPDVLLNTDTQRRWQFTDSDQFPVHGETDPEGNFVAEIGYTQFIHSWLQFQGLQTTTDFAEPMRTLNMKLAHRMSGYVDKDTMTVRTDQFSNDGNATSLIIPQENITVGVHSSAYKSRNFYSGVQIEKTAGGYRVRGYDKNQPYFVILQSDTLGPRERVTVGGEPASSVLWESGKTYRKGTIVERQGTYWQANLNITSGGEFDRSLWTRLATLPQIGGATSTLYQRTTGRELRVNYETEFATVDQVYDFLISLGRYQQRQGYDFGEYDDAIADVRNWAYAGRQFLFWSTGRWEIGNTLELSPLAPRARFSTPLGFLARIDRTDRDQFSIVNAAGAVIDPKQCEIVRAENRIEVAPPEGEQIYGILLYVKEVEHALVLDNFTEFADVIYNPELYQKHSRVKVSGTRTAGWTGRLLTEGFIVEGNELKPNLDNLAETMGRFYELGYVPVEKQVYEQSRALFGYDQRDYLRELDIIDDQQFDFYRGMIQSKGTTDSLTKLARSRAVVDGNISVFGEWGLRVGDFGDTENNQRLELRINKSDLVQDPQLITLDFPEDITNVIDRIDILEPVYEYITPPEIRLPPPTVRGGTQATARAVLGTDGRLARIDVTNPGSGYDPADINDRVIAVVSDVVVDSSQQALSPAVAQSSDTIDFSAPVSFEIQENISNTTVSVANANTIVEAVGAINSASVSNLHLSAQAISVPANGNVEYGILLVGSDYTVTDGGDINIAEERYQPKQKYAIITTGTSGDAVTVADDIRVLIDDVAVPSANNWTYTASVEDDITAGTVFPDTYAAYTSSDSSDRRIEFELSQTFDSTELDSQGRYEYIELYINGVRVRNTQDSVDLITGNVTSSGQLFEIDNTVTPNKLIFPDTNLLPDAVLSELKDPPADRVLDYGEQRETYFGFDENTEFRVLQKATVEFQDALQLDLPGSTVRVEVTANDRIVARTRIIRTFEISADIQDPNVLSIDIDDTDRFLVRPTGVRENSLWPTVSDVDHTGITASSYPSIPNAGYVNPANVNFQAYDLSSLPDLYADNIVVKPDTGDLVHIAVSENSDWNVYRLRKLLANEGFLFRNDQGTVDLYTDVSLFNFLDSNQIGQPNTGKYLDYVLTLKNANLSDNVVVWRNEDIVQAQQFDITDFEAPRMIEARIASIGPSHTDTITDVEPTQGRTLQNLTLSPFTDGTDRVLVTGPDMGTMRNGDAVQLIDNVGTINQVDSHVEQSDDVLTLFTGTVSSIDVIDGGDGYTAVPDVTVDSPTAGTNADVIARVQGPITDISVTDSGDFSGAFVEVFGSGSNASLDVDIVNGSVTEITVISAGDGYDANSLPNVSIDAPISGNAATLSVTSDDIDPVTGGILRVRITDSGDGYTASEQANITIDDPASGNTAELAAVIRGNIDVSVTDGGEGFYVGNTTASIAGDGEFAQAQVTVTGTVTDVLVEDGGTGFTDTPNVTIDAPLSGNTATANATLSTGLEFVQQAQAQSVTGDAFVKIQATANTDATTSTAPGIEEIYQQAFDIVEALQNDVFLVENLDTSNNSFTISDDRFGEAAGELELSYNYTLEANANANTSVLTLDTVENIIVSDSLLVESNSIGNVSNVISGSNQVVLDTALAEDLEAGTQIKVIRETVYVADFLDVSGYTVTTRESYEPVGSNVDYHIVDDVTVNSFVINRANTASANNVLGLHLNKTRLVVPAHSYELGDVIRVNTNVFSGDFTVDAVTANTLIIDNSFVSGFQSGEIVQQGIRITTTEPHGITPVYAQSGKRVAVHFAEPLYYNKVYPISRVTPDSIFVDDIWPINDQTQTFYETRTGTLSGAEPFLVQTPLTPVISANASAATNTIRVSGNARLNDIVVHYASNSALISEKYVTVQDVYVDADTGNIVDKSETGSVYSETLAIIDPDALPSNTAVSTDIVVTRQTLKPNHRYPVLTTLDHDTVDINGVRIRVDNYNNPQAVAASINRAIGLRRSLVKNVNGRFGMEFAMLKDPRTQIQDGRSANEISDYGAYVRDENVIRRLGGDQYQVREELPLEDPTELVQDPQFDRGSILVGPHRGLFYYDPDLGRQYVWNSTVGDYTEIATSTDRAGARRTADTDRKVSKPEFHRASKVQGFVANWRPSTSAQLQDIIESGTSQPLPRIVYKQDAVVYYESRYYRALQDIDVSDNIQFDQDLWQEISNESELSQIASVKSLILRTVPGTATTQGVNTDTPGIQRPEYDLSSFVTFDVNGDTQELARYRLKENSENAFQVYEAVQHELDDEPYYILIDQSSPLTVPHDFYGTINAHSDFGGYQQSEYYYKNGLLPAPTNSTGKLTDDRDPVILKRLGSHVVVLPPVEPAREAPEQVVPEPFAVSGGNGTSAVENFSALPRLRISSPDSGEAITDEADVRPGGLAQIEAEVPGYNEFLLWTPGLEPGAWKPTAQGPGALPGPNSTTVSLGRGRGYYQPDDDHQPQGGGYPELPHTHWDKPLPRFLYSSKFSVSPEVRNYTQTVFTDENGQTLSDDQVIDRLNRDEVVNFTEVSADLSSAGDPDINNTQVRPEEIYVACFWTEPHRYRNQLVEWNYNTLDARGLPQPIYADYDGTVVRVKYIRLTELPPNAVTQRLIPDTGWAGKNWANNAVDTVDFQSTESESDIWSQFETEPVRAGSTGSLAESVPTRVVRSTRNSTGGVNNG